ncbi:MAG TPA: hypothetical protein VKZ53_06755 [Candidatus Angelobacter sp.]|nr:hypothetical protein [Candidatus Angelobacter sp.]
MSIKVAGIFLLAFEVIGNNGSTQTIPHRGEQLHFSAEAASVTRPTSIPQDVLAILRKDDGVRGALNDEGIQAEQIPASWFSASAIHLGNPNRIDLVVMGEGPLRGANVITFWVFQSASRGYALVLTAPAHDLIVMNTRSKGFRDIELVSMSARQISSVLLRFNGMRYTKHTAKAEAIQ